MQHLVSRSGIPAPQPTLPDLNAFKLEVVEQSRRSDRHRRDQSVWHSRCTVAPTRECSRKSWQIHQANNAERRGTLQSSRPLGMLGTMTSHPPLRRRMPTLGPHYTAGRIPPRDPVSPTTAAAYAAVEGGDSAPQKETGRSKQRCTGRTGRSDIRYRNGILMLS